MRRAAKKDGNHDEIVAALQEYGWWTYSTAGLGDGFPDLIAVRNGQTWLIEIKNGWLPPSARRLTDDEERFRRAFPGRYRVIESTLDVREFTAQVCSGNV